VTKALWARSQLREPRDVHVDCLMLRATLSRVKMSGVGGMKEGESGLMGALCKLGNSKGEKCRRVALVYHTSPALRRQRTAALPDVHVQYRAVVGRAVASMGHTMGGVRWEKGVRLETGKMRRRRGKVSLTSAEETTRSRSCLRSGALGLSNDIHALRMVRIKKSRN